MRLYLAYFNLVACDLVPFDSNFETECKLFTQYLVLDNDCCIIRNVGRTEINLVTSNNFFIFVLFFVYISKRSKSRTQYIPILATLGLLFHVQIY